MTSLIEAFEWIMRCAKGLGRILVFLLIMGLTPIGFALLAEISDGELLFWMIANPSKLKRIPGALREAFLAYVVDPTREEFAEPLDVPALTFLRLT